MNDAAETQHEGRFQWNRGGWFGGQLGGTLWLLLLGGLLLAQGHPVGALVVVLGLFANAVGCLLWRARRRWAPYPALQLLIAVCGLCAAAALGAVYVAGRTVPGWSFPQAAYALAVYPALMAMFSLQERSARR